MLRRFLVLTAVVLGFGLTAQAAAAPTYTVTCARTTNGKPATTWSLAWSDSLIDRIRVYAEGASLDDPAQVKRFKASDSGTKRGRIRGSHSQLIIYWDLDATVINGGARTCS